MIAGKCAALWGIYFYLRGGLELQAVHDFLVRFQGFELKEMVIGFLLGKEVAHL